MHKEASGEKRSGTARRAKGWLVSYPRAIPLALFMIIAAITIFSVFVIERNSRETNTVQARETALALASSLKHQVKDATSYLTAAGALLSTSQEANAGLFEEFTSQADLQDFGATGMGWASASSSAAGETQPVIVRAFNPAVSENGQELLVKLSQDPAFVSALESASAGKQPIATEMLASQRGGTNTELGWILAIVMPVETAISSEQVSEEFVFIPFDADALLRAAIEDLAHSEMSAALYDSNVSEENQLTSPSIALAASDLVEIPVEIGERPYVLAVEKSSPSGFDPMSYATLFFGLALAILMFLLARLIGRQTAEDQMRLAFFEEQYSIRNSLTRELNHRVKNTLANVLSILALTRRRSENLDDFAESFEGRIRALSATHDLLTNSEWGTTPLRSVIEAELAHVSASYGQKVELIGPPVELAPNDALTFGQAIHELATNAAKYGALSDGSGSVKVEWNLVDPQLVEIEWHESGGPRVSDERDNGFGTDLIQKIVAHELKQPVILDFAPEGVRCVLRVAVRQRDSFKIRQTP